MIYFDTRTIKLLKTIYKHQKGISFAKLCEKFYILESDSTDFQDLIYDLYHEGYIKCDDPSKDFVILEITNRLMMISPKAIFSSTQKGNAFVEKLNQDFSRWWITTFISIIALIIATISLVR